MNAPANALDRRGIALLATTAALNAASEKRALSRAMNTLAPFMGKAQQSVVRQVLREEGEWFAGKMIELAALVSGMPETYGQDGVADPIAHLHYFKGSQDWYITEKDAGDGSPDKQQHQAYGLANLFMDGGERGYISIAELIANNVELDFNFAPRPLSEVGK